MSRYIETSQNSRGGYNIEVTHEGRSMFPASNLNHAEAQHFLTHLVMYEGDHVFAPGFKHRLNRAPC